MLPFHAFPRLIFLFVGPIINNEIKNKKWKKSNSNIFIIWNVIRLFSSPTTRSRSHFVPSVLHTFLILSPPLFMHSFLHSYPSPSNAVDSTEFVPLHPSHSFSFSFCPLHSSCVPFSTHPHHHPTLQAISELVPNAC